MKTSIRKLQQHFSTFLIWWHTWCYPKILGI